MRWAGHVARLVVDGDN